MEVPREGFDSRKLCCSTINSGAKKHHDARENVLYERIALICASIQGDLRIDIMMNTKNICK